MRALRLAAFELLRFRRPLQRAGLAFLLIVPLLYGGIYLWSNWDPYGRLDQVPVAVVNDDRPVRVEGRTIDAGADFVTELEKDPLLGWRFTDGGEAADGLEDGRYYAVITVPADFSAKLASGANGTPRKAATSIRLDDANNFLVGIMAETVQSELQRQISAAAVAAYFEAAFGKLTELHDGISDAADGAEELDTGLVKAKDGSGRLVSGLGTAREGTAELATGLASAKDGTGELATGLRSAKTGSAALATGLVAAEEGTGELVTGLGRLKAGSSELATGLGSAETGSGQLVDGLGRLKTGTAELAPGAAQLSQGIHRLTSEAVPIAEDLSAALPGLADTAVTLSGDAADLTSLGAALAARVAATAKEVDDWLHGIVRKYPEIARSPRFADLRKAVTTLDGTIASRLEALAAEFPQIKREPGYATVAKAAATIDATLVSRLHRLENEHPELRNDPVWEAILKLADEITERAQEIAKRAARINAVTQEVAGDARTFKRNVPALQRELDEAATGLTTLDRGGAEVAAGARTVDQGVGSALAGAARLDTGIAAAATGMSTLDKGIGTALTGTVALDKGTTRAATGMVALDKGIGSALTGAVALDRGEGKLLDGANELNEGSGKLLAGARELDQGNTELEAGASELASGLKSAEDQIPVIDPDDRESYARTLAQPVDVTKSNAHPAGKYGRGLAPFFISIAMWVFGIVAFLLLRPVSGRALASGAGAATVAFAAWLPVLFMGVLAAVVLFAVLTFGLGLDPVNSGATVGLMSLGVASFSAIVHVLRLALGAVGDALALALLILQLVSCGGLYPVETLPQPFRAVHDVIPMTYLVAPLRATISGGQSSHVWRDAGVLAAFLVVALALLVLVVRTRRRWSMARLKPDLEL
ncbi:YhgE/Pip domain-containing protein [Spirillospora sp. NPDC047279]|uniref:YhgE/Pip domain-containing protein n=1 Tax=Spirillospora sp. NPDC047279 TaxID=3155478 RepID=UPI003411A378